MFDLLKVKLKVNSHRIAIVSSGRDYTYKLLSESVEKNEREFRAIGIDSRSIVVLIGEFSFETLACMLALFFCKATVVPLTKGAHAKLGKYVAALNPDYTIDTYRGGALQSCDYRGGDDTEWRNILPLNSGVLIVFTSGSTGVPKAIVHDIDNLCYRYLNQKLPISSICFLQFDHMGGINTILSLLFRGGTAVNITERNVDVVCEAIQRYKVELLPTTPSFLSQFLMARAHNNYDLSSLLVISYGTEVMSMAVLKRMIEVLPACKFKQTYGLSETGVLQIKSRANDSLWFKFIDVGVDWKVEDQVLWIKTKSNLLGKFQFIEDGLLIEEKTNDWFCTNDLVDTDGEYLLIKGRKSDIINVAGLKVYPSEVENCILDLPFINEVFVTAKKNPLLGHIVVAYIQIDNLIEKAVAEKVIRQHCKARLEKHKVPSQYIFKWENFINDRFKKVRSI